MINRMEDQGMGKIASRLLEVGMFACLCAAWLEVVLVVLGLVAGGGFALALLASLF